MTTNSTDSTLWEKLTRIFHNSWIGILILIILAISKVLSDNYKNIKTYQADNQTSVICKTLIDINDQISSKIKILPNTDSIRVSLRKYLDIRNSLNEPPSSEVKKKEADLLREFLGYTHSLVTNYRNSIKLNQNKDVLEYKRTLIPLCNEILNFCDKTSTCSEAETKTLKITIDELRKN